MHTNVLVILSFKSLQLKITFQDLEVAIVHFNNFNGVGGFDSVLVIE